MCWEFGRVNEDTLKLVRYGAAHVGLDGSRVNRVRKGAFVIVLGTDELRKTQNSELRDLSDKQSRLLSEREAAVAHTTYRIRGVSRN